MEMKWKLICLEKSERTYKGEGGEQGGKPKEKVKKLGVKG